MTMNQILGYFLIYGYLGWMLECLYASLKAKKWVKRRGALTQYFLPLYGICGVLIIGVFEMIEAPLVAALVSGLLITLLEGVVGWWLDYAMDLKLWDYSVAWGNIKGYVCVPFTFIWIGLAWIVALGVAPVVGAVIGTLAEEIEWGLISIGLMMCFTDAILFRKKLLVKYK